MSHLEFVEEKETTVVSHLGCVEDCEYMMDQLYAWVMGWA